MPCRRCQAATPPDAQFCPECGAPLTTPCPACGTPNLDRYRFCTKCGGSLASAPAAESFSSPATYTPKHLAERILVSRGALEGERKQVSVLFVDVSGFTSLSERLDPEDVHGIMTRAFELMLDEVHRYEGTVNQFLGDGIMALFGAPLAHEDHARRAVQAALGIRRALEDHQAELRETRGLGYRVRQGLNTGLVVVGSIGNDLRMDYTAVGDTTNVAARLQQAAEPGRIVISQTTHRLVEGYFHTRPLGPLALKGKKGEVPAWEVIATQGARTRLDVEAERGLTTLVGRERELGVLTGCFGRAKAGHGQVVFVVGEAGIGKSRLLLELRRRLGDEATWVEGRAMSFGRATAFHPLIDLLRRTFRIEEADDDPAIIRKIEWAVLRLGEDLRPILPFIRLLLSVDPGDPAILALDPRQRRIGTFDALRTLTARAAEIRPQVLVFEDLHWMDGATEEYLRQTVDSIPAQRIMIVLTYRPGYAHPLGERSYHTHLPLAALTATESAELARAMLAADALPEDLRELVARKGDGNPFFVEEMVKSLQEAGALRRSEGRYVLAMASEGVVPDTIQDLVMARIDRLDEAPKRTLQLASVIGREFTRRLMDRLAGARERTDESLTALKDIELIYEKSVLPELAYMFKHALTHEVAYGSLLVQRRKELHRTIGLAVEELYADRLTEHYEMLAHHFTRGESWVKAIAYLLAAAEKAARSFAVREALALYDQAIEVCRHLDGATSLAKRQAIHQAQSNHYFTLGEYERARSSAERTAELAHETGDLRGEAAALAWAAFAGMWAQDFQGALSQAERAIGLAEPIGDSAALGAAYLTTGYVHALSGRLTEAEIGLGRAATTSGSAGDAARESLALQMGAFVPNWRGDAELAATLSGRGLQIAREQNLQIPLLRALWAHGLVLGNGCRYDQAIALLEEGLALVERVGDDAFIPRYLNTMGWLYAECEDHAKAIEISRAAAERTRNWHHPVGVEMMAYSRINEGDALLARGDLAGARDALDEIDRLVANPKTHVWMRWRYSTHLLASLGELGLAQGDPAGARAFADRCLEVASRTSSRKFLAWGWRLRGESALARGRADEAEAALREAAAIAGAIGYLPQLWRTGLALARLHTAARHEPAAREARLAARAALDRLRSRALDPRLRQGFEHSPRVRQLQDLGGDD